MHSQVFPATLPIWCHGKHLYSSRYVVARQQILWEYSTQSIQLIYFPPIGVSKALFHCESLLQGEAASEIWLQGIWKTLCNRFTVSMFAHRIKNLFRQRVGVCIMWPVYPEYFYSSKLVWIHVKLLKFSGTKIIISPNFSECTIVRVDWFMFNSAGEAALGHPVLITVHDESVKKGHQRQHRIKCRIYKGDREMQDRFASGSCIAPSRFISQQRPARCTLSLTYLLKRWADLLY